MVLLELTPALRDRLNALAPRLPPELQERVASHLVGSEDQAAQAGPRNDATTAHTSHRALAGRTVPHEALVAVSRWANGAEGLEDRDQYRLASLLRLTDVYAPALPPREKSPELLAILAQIQLDADRRSYASLTSLSPAPHPSLVPLHDPFDSTAYGGPPKSVAEEWKEIRREVGAIVNVGASMLAVGTGLWWVGGGRSYAERLCLALAGAVAIAATEAFLYYRFFTRLAQAKQPIKEPARRRVAKGAGQAGPHSSGRAKRSVAAKEPGAKLE
ncbi:TMEM199/VMA12 family protein [Rhodotorula paludigena]|uniref:TMEM199/VMA12 family protein n=1 Tax=Rhodotorula paludigena TaxID=86838 RepID=UPI003177E8D0